MDVTEPPPAPVRHDASDCATAGRILGRIGDRWTARILINLLGHGHRFGELQRAVEGVTHRMLALTLRNMERDGLVTRRVTPSVPPRVDYELTEIGRSLAGRVLDLGEWAFSHAERISAAQASYDAREEGAAGSGGGGAVPA